MIKYIITGDQDEVTTITEGVAESKTFLSETENVIELTMRPISEDWLATEITVAIENIIDTKELCILSAEFTSITIGVVKDDKVSEIISGGQVDIV